MASPCTFEEYSKIAEHSRARTITVVQAYIRPDGKPGINWIGYVSILQRRKGGPYTVAICDQGNDPNVKGWAFYLGNSADVDPDPVSAACKGATIGGETLDGTAFCLGILCHRMGWEFVKN